MMDGARKASGYSLMVLCTPSPAPTFKISWWSAKRLATNSWLPDSPRKATGEWAVMNTWSGGDFSLVPKEPRRRMIRWGSSPCSSSSIRMTVDCAAAFLCNPRSAVWSNQSQVLEAECHPRQPSAPSGGASRCGKDPGLRGRVCAPPHPESPKRPAPGSGQGLAPHVSWIHRRLSARFRRLARATWRPLSIRALP